MILIVAGITVNADGALVSLGEQTPSLKHEAWTRLCVVGENSRVQRRGSTAAFIPGGNDACQIKASTKTKIQAAEWGGIAHPLPVKGQTTVARLVADAIHTKLIVCVINNIGERWQRVFHATKGDKRFEIDTTVSRAQLCRLHIGWTCSRIACALNCVASATS
jgi:hypothetical protein